MPKRIPAKQSLMLFLLWQLLVYSDQLQLWLSRPKNKEKDMKAAEHSISSGLIGYGFAILVFSPIKKALDKIKAHPEHFAKKLLLSLNMQTKI